MIKIFNLYKVKFDTNDTTDSIYDGIDKEEAFDVFNSYDINDVDERFKNRSDLYVTIEKCTDKYKFVHEIDDEYESIEDYPIEDYYNTDYYELIDEGDYEELDHKTLEPINKKSDNLLNDVQSYYKDLYGKYKYNIILVYDEQDDLIGTISLRIADHTENLNNNGRFEDCDYYISVVIADDDATKTKFQYNDLEKKDDVCNDSYNDEDDDLEMEDKQEKKMEANHDTILK